ncbi:MAG: pilus assembly protein PilM [Limisphaerales bacterium]
MTDEAIKRNAKLNRSLTALKERRGGRVSAVTALVVEADNLRVVEAVANGNDAAVKRVVCGPLDIPLESEKPSAETLGNAIRQTLRELKIKPGPVVMGVPRARVILRNLVLPSLPDLNELAQMLHFQIGRELPFPMTEAIIDFKVLHELEEPAKPDTESTEETESANKLEVLVATARRESIDYYQQVAESAGVKLIGLGWLPYTTARCAEIAKITERAYNVAIISLRPSEVGIDIVGHDSLLFSRDIAVNLVGDATPDSAQCPEEYSGTVVIEVVRSLHGFTGMEHGEPIRKIVVAGETDCEQKVVDRLAKEFGVETILFDPKRLDIPDESAKAARGAMSAIGLAEGAACSEGLRFDFLNPKKPRPPKDLGKIKLIGGIAGVFLLIALLFGIRSSLVNKRMKIYDELNAEAAKIQKHTKIFKQMKLQASTLRKWEAGGRNWLDHFAHVSAALPRSEEVYVTSFTVGRGGTIRLGVQAKSGEIISRLDRQLRTAGYDVKPIAINPASDRYGYNFRSAVELRLTAKTVPNLSTNLPPARPADDGSLEINGGAG